MEITSCIHFFVVVFNQPQFTALCFNSLELALQSSGVTDLWLIDNGSNPEQLSVWNSMFNSSEYRVHRIRHEQNNFLMPALNAIIAQALNNSSPRDIIMVSDNDTVWPPGSIQKTIAHLRAGNAHVVCPEGDFGNQRAFHQQTIRRLGWDPIHVVVQEHVTWALEQVANKPAYDGFYSSTFVTWAYIWQEVGGFDEVFRLIYNDVDWRWRALLHNYTCKIFPDTPIFHYSGATRTTGDYLTQNHQDIIEFCEKWQVSLSEVLDNWLDNDLLEQVLNRTQASYNVVLTPVSSYLDEEQQKECPNQRMKQMIEERSRKVK